MKCYVILIELVDENGKSFFAEILMKGFKTQQAAQQEIDKQTQEDKRNGWNYKYTIYPVLVTDWTV